VGPNVLRICELARKFPGTHFSVIADSAPSIRGLSVAARDAGITMDVLLDLDCGMGRTGIAPGKEAAELYKLISGSSGLRAAGLHAYDGHIHEGDVTLRRQLYETAMGPVLKFRQELEALSLPVPLLVAGGSPTFPFHAQNTDRESSPGTTVLWDFGYGDKFTDLPFLPAAVLLTRVISRQGNRLCLDLGHKAVASENPHPRVRILELPDANFVMHSEEHLVIESPQAGEFSVGQTLHGIPRHVCPTVALHSEAIVVENGAAVTRWPILARARRLSV
jgi:D-serine deaminase-like pyridoxal phosphate-dependent protein